MNSFCFSGGRKMWIFAATLFSPHSKIKWTYFTNYIRRWEIDWDFENEVVYGIKTKSQLVCTKNSSWSYQIFDTFTTFYVHLYKKYKNAVMGVLLYQIDYKGVIRKFLMLYTVGEENPDSRTVPDIRSITAIPLP